MMKKTELEDTINLKTPPVQKKRRCLLCKKSFDSTWAGNRVCRQCKSTAAWRSGH